MSSSSSDRYPAGWLQWLDEYEEDLRLGRAPSLDRWLADHQAPAELRPRLERIQWLYQGSGERPAETLEVCVSMPEIPGHRIECEIGRGGMSVVYRARQEPLGRLVAVKMILAGPLASPEQLARFRGEAEKVASLDHPNICPLYEFGEVHGQPYFSMRLLEHGTLAQRKDEIAGRPEQAADLVRQVALAVHYAHQRGILHRDLKPSNILMDAEGTPYVADFGLARWIDQGSELTRSGTVVGTPGYLPPELAAGDPRQLSTAADVYGLGVTLYELLTGRRPFEGRTALETLWQVQTQPPPRPRAWSPSLPADLEAICLQCLNRQPEQRYATAAELADDLQRHLQGDPVRARPLSLYRSMRQWIRGHRTLAVSAVLMLTILIGTLAVTSAGWRIAVRARRRAELGLYVSRVARAQLECDADQVAAAQEILARCIPRPGHPDLRGWEWYFLRALCDTSLAVTSEHEHWLYAVDVSLDNQWLAFAGGDPFHPERPGELSLRRRSSRLAAERKTQCEGGPVQDVLFLADGAHLAIAQGTKGRRGTVGRVSVLRCDNLKPSWTIELKEAAICLEELADGTLMCGTSEGNLVACSLTGHLVGRWAVHDDAITGLRVTRRGQIVTCSLDGTVRRCQGDPTAIDLVYQGPAGIRTLDVHPDGHLALGMLDDLLLLRPGQTAPRKLSGHRGWIWKVQFLPDGRLISASADGTLRLWNGADESAARTLRGHTWGVRDFAVDSSWKMLYSAGQDRTVRAWSLHHDRSPIRRWEGEQPARFVNKLQFAADSQSLTAVRAAGCVEQIACQDGERPGKAIFVGLSAAHRWPHDDTAISPSGLLLAGPTEVNRSAVGVWDIRQGREVCRLPHPQPVTAVTFLGSSRLLATATLDSDTEGAQIRIWDLPSGSLRRSYPVHGTGPVYCLQYREEEYLLTTAGEDGVIRDWDLQSGQLQASFTGHASEVSSLAYAPERQLLVSGGYRDGTVRAWDLKRQIPVRILQGPRPILTVELSPDRKRVAAAGPDEVRLWDLESGAEVFTLRAKGPRRPEDIAFRPQVVFSPDGSRIATSHWDGAIHIWQAERSTRHTVRPTPLLGIER